MTKYFGRDGRAIHRHEWSRLLGDHSYSVVREYDNGEVFVRLRWHGEVSDPNIFRDCWNLFLLTVGNYNAVGELKADPVENGKWFAYEEDGIKAYEAFLTRWTPCCIDADGRFEECDNTLAPPPPPNPDVPVTDILTLACLKLGDDDVGVW
ncbi:MAG: hypothetical protein FWF12_00245 [Betaproteobacteria bacterium]|nr:hypothetical protein [Betaproteobacteria bacterium]